MLNFKDQTCIMDMIFVKREHKMYQLFMRLNVEILGFAKICEVVWNCCTQFYGTEFWGFFFFQKVGK